MRRKRKYRMRRKYGIRRKNKYRVKRKGNIYEGKVNIGWGGKVNIGWEGRDRYIFAPIFYLNCEHVLFVYFKKKSSRISWKKIFFYKNKKTFKHKFFTFFYIHKPSLVSREIPIPQKNWIRSVQPFWRLLDTNRQTSKVYIYILGF